MAGWFSGERRRRGKTGPAVFSALLAAALCAFFSGAAMAQKPGGGDIRALKIYFVQTQEKDEVVFKRNGHYVRSGLRRLNYLLRDWRRNESTAMDPRLFDLVWQIYQLSGSRAYIYAVSGYRSPQTNAMLRLAAPAGVVAEHSRHMEGQAMDFYLPDVSPAYLRALALKLQGGGIGYYPASASPFVHIDVGTVRHWPRMSRQALAALFPDGKSLHVPSDGRPLAHYEEAAAEYRQRGAAALPVFSARALLGGLSPQQAALAAADGRLPLGRYGSRADDAPPPPAALLAALAPAQVPIPMAAPIGLAEAEETWDEAEIKTGSIPVPRFKNRLDRAAENEDNELLAYAPVAGADAGLNSRALQALSRFAPIPAAKPSPAVPDSAAAGAGQSDSGDDEAPAAVSVVPVPQRRPTILAAAATAAAPPAAAMPFRSIPLPQYKSSRAGG